ncbi:MAG: hypothetical protein Q9227_001254 [Pyrenula ochraceoflavens]
MSNPTLAAANSDTSTQPLNAQPSKPQAPAHHLEPASYIPAPLQTLTAKTASGAPFLPVSLPFEHSQPASSLPSAPEFEDLIKSTGHTGPARAEEVAGEEFGDLLTGVSKAVDDGLVKVFKVVTGTKGKEDLYYVGLRSEEERIVGMKASASGD